MASSLPRPNAVSLDPANERIREARAAGTACCWFDGQDIHFSDGKAVELTLAAADIPITMGGDARFNVQNVMGAIGLAKAMGLGDQANIDGLTRFQASPDDNPDAATSSWSRVRASSSILRITGNAIAAMSNMLDGLSAKRKYLLISLPGDRSDQEIAEFTQGALQFHPNVNVAADLPDYLRGRALGEVPALIARQCIDSGLEPGAIKVSGSPGEGVAMILDDLQQGDVALIIALSIAIAFSA